MKIYFGDRGLPEIYKAQSILKLLKLYHAGIDGIYAHGTQKAVGLFQQAQKLEITGILDKQTYEKLLEAYTEFKVSPPMPTFEMEAILAAYQKKSYKLNEEQYKINLLGIRKDNFFDNRFSDRLIIFWKNEKNDWEKKEFEWTTMPGTLGRGGVFNPKTVEGMTGVAVLVEGQYLDTWKFYNTYYGWLGYPFFQQVKPLKIKRDNTKDAISEYDTPQQEGLYGINIHRMSGNGRHERYVNNAYTTWSIGCQGAPEPVFREIVRLSQISQKYHGDIFSYTLMHREDFATVREIDESHKIDDYFTCLTF